MGPNAGYCVADRVFERSVMDDITAALSVSHIPRTKAGARHVLAVPEVRALAEHATLVSLAASFIGGEPIPFRATLFDKSATSNWLVAWHQDTALPVRWQVEASSWGPWSLKGGVPHAIAPASALDTIVALRVHLDDSTENNGPLRVLPGTHRSGVLSHDEIQHLAAAVPPVTCVTGAGGVVAMRPLIVHASSKSTDDQPRRVLHIEYCTSFHLDGGVELAPGYGAFTAHDGGCVHDSRPNDQLTTDRRWLN